MWIYKWIYVRILFVDFSSAFNTIIPNLTQLSVPTSICQWINSFLTDRQQLVRLGKFSYSTRIISTGAPQGCVLSPLLFSLYTNNCTSKDPSIFASPRLMRLSSSWSLQMTPHWSASSRTVTSLITDRRLRSWLSGAVLTTWSSRRSKLWRWLWTSGETPCSPPTHHHEQHCDCSGVIQFPGHHYLSQHEVGQSHRLHCEKGRAEAVLPSPAEEVQPATGAAENFLLCHHWIRPLHINNCLVQLSYQIWTQKTTGCSLDCWVNHWYNPPHSPRTVLIQSEQKCCQNHSGPFTSSTLLFELLPSGRRYRALSTRTTRHRNSFFPQAIHLMNTWQ